MILIVFISAFIANIHAQGFSVTPVRMAFSLEPGLSESKTIVIRNTTDRALSMVVNVKDWIHTKDGDINVLSPNKLKRSCANWISFTPSFFNLNPNELQEIQVNLTVPDGVDSTKWAAIMVSDVEEKTTASVDKESAYVGVRATSAVVIRIFQSPKSNVRHNVVMNNFREVESDKEAGRSFLVDVFNEGDKVTNCKVYLMISDLQTAEERTISPALFYLLPGSYKSVDIKLPADLGSGKYNFVAILDYGEDYDLIATQMDIEVE